MKKEKEETHPVVLIEVGGSHDECLLTQIRALKDAGKNGVVVLDRVLMERNQHLLAEGIVLHGVEVNGRKKGKVARELARFIRLQQPEQVVFNTAQGTIVRNLCLWMSLSRIPFVGIVHTTRKFDGSFTQRIIHLKIKRYLFLSEFLLHKTQLPKGITADYFYPIDFPKGKVSAVDQRANRIVITGGVESRRKDLEGFLAIAQQLSEFTFVFLGKSDPTKDEVKELKAKMESLGLQSRVQFFDDFVPDEVFFGELERAKYILPLVHPNTPSADQYFKNQISGGMTLSFAFKIPLLLHSAYAEIVEMKSAAFYYQLDSIRMNVDRAEQEYRTKVEGMVTEKVFQSATQRKRYTGFIFPYQNSPE